MKKVKRPIIQYNYIVVRQLEATQGTSEEIGLLLRGASYAALVKKEQTVGAGGVSARQQGHALGLGKFRPARATYGTFGVKTLLSLIRRFARGRQMSAENGV